MVTYLSYSVRITEYSNIFRATAEIFRSAVDYIIAVINAEWETFSEVSSASEAVRPAERLIHMTRDNPCVKYPDFDTKFYKFPSYLRRAAIAHAYGKVRSYRSNLENWKNSDPRKRGRAPGLPKAGMIYPAMYNGNTYVREDTYTAKIKVYINNTWDWITVKLKKSDADYIIRRFNKKEECVPTLRKRGKRWSLDFAFKEKVTLRTVPVKEQKILSVDLGINTACVCVLMNSDGTVAGRRFLRLPEENDCLNRKISHIKYAQKHGSRKLSGQWRIANGINDDIAVKTAQFIAETAMLFHADVIVFEHLDTGGRKHGSKKQRLHLWKAKYVKAMVTDKAHRLNMRVSTVCATNTSRLAFDGSGEVKRGSESKKTDDNYSLCEFTTGKVYNCDLNAAYNIGARYFIREISKSVPVTEWQRITAKVPECAKRSTCTLSALISLNAELSAAA